MRGCGFRAFASLSKARTLSRVDRMDIDDFRLRVLHRLKKPVEDAKDVARASSLARSSMLELPTGSLEPSLQASHIEKDKELLRALLEFAISPNKPKQWLQEMFDSLRVGSTPSDCFQLLIDLEVVKPETNPCVLRFEEPLLFSPQILAEVPRVLKESSTLDPDAKLRHDLGDQAVLTIDAVTATEIDDAVGLHTDELGREWVHVHVADVARLVQPKSPLEVYAARRAVSVFLPETHFPLLPHGVSHALSLLPGRANFALTFAARLSDEGSIEEMQVFSSVIRNVCKISYRSADALFAPVGPRPDIVLAPAHEKTLFRLKEIAARRRAMREGRGAVTLQLPEPEVRVQGKKVQLLKTERSSVSRSLIEEMMILGGEVAASFAREHELPIPYRVQRSTRPASAPAAKKSANPLVAALLEMDRHPPAFMDVLPGPHHSLGMPAYTQVTSPIRRYADLMVANQIKAHLRGDSLPFSSWDILRYRDHHETTVRRVETLQQNSIRYWMLKHLSSDEFKSSRLGREGVKALVLGRPVAANSSGGATSVLRSSDAYESGDLASVYLEELLMRAVVKLRPGQRLREGDSVVLKVVRVDPLRLTVDFELAE